MGNTNDGRCYAHNSSIFVPLVNSSAKYRVGLYMTIEDLES